MFETISQLLKIYVPNLSYYCTFEQRPLGAQKVHQQHHQQQLGQSLDLTAIAAGKNWTGYPSALLLGGRRGGEKGI